MLRVTVCMAVLVLLLAAGCRSAPPETTGTAVVPGDTLYGRLPPGRDVQAFSFEGVEGSLLDFDVLSDAPNQAAPRVELHDPVGQRVDIASARDAPLGAATMTFRDVVLLKNGIYRVDVRPPGGATPTWYRFRHELRFPPVEGRRVTLEEGRAHPIYVSAPRRGLVAFRIRPEGRTGLEPRIRAVKDPWGGRALDRRLVPQGANPPRLSRGRNGARVLTFTAPRPGRYTILADARPGTRGVAAYSVEVRPPAGPGRVVYHPNTPPHFGVPGNPAGDAPPTAPPPPPALAPPANARRPVRRPPPASPLPPDRPIAAR